MWLFFIGIRYSLLTNHKFGKYAIYALGEIDSLILGVDRELSDEAL
jgi:hypothetical protein